MKNSILTFAMAIIVLNSCKTEDPLDGECYFIADTVPPWIFYVELVDANGNNLIDNGFYDKDNITVKLNDDDFDSLILDKEPDHLLPIWAIGKEGDNRLLLTLSETDVDTLGFSWTSQLKKSLVDGYVQCSTDFYLNALSYNGADIDFGGPTPGIPMDIRIKIVKPTD